MRIAIIAGSIPTTTFIDALINGMAERGYTMIVIGRKDANYNYHNKVETIEVPRERFKQFIFVLRNIFKLSFSNLRNIYRNSNSVKVFFNNLLFYLPIFKSRPDKVHLQWASFIYKKEILFDLFPNIILISLRGAHINYTPITKPEIAECYMQLFPRVYKFHAVCNAIAKEAGKYGAEKDKIQTIYSFVDESVLKNGSVKSETKLILKIISVGRFHWAKGYEYALDAMYELKKGKINFSYTIVARGEIPENILFQIHQLDLADNIKIINGLSHKEVFREINNNDLFLLPSVEEGIANVVLESMAIGVPVMSTNCGGMDEVITDKYNGFLVELRNPKQMSYKITEFNDLSRDERRVVSENAQKGIIKNHSKELFLDQYIKFYS